MFLQVIYFLSDTKTALLVFYERNLSGVARAVCIAVRRERPITACI